MKNVTTRTYQATDYVTVKEVKDHLRVLGNDDDLYIANLVDAAFDHLSNLLGYEPRKSTVEYFYTSGYKLHIPARVLSLTSVKYRDSAGDLQTLASTNYDEVLTISANYGYDVVLINAPSSLYSYGWKYKVTVVEGFAKSGDSVDISKLFPQALRHAVYLMCETLYTQRGEVIVGAIAEQLPAVNIDSLVSPYAIKEFV